jgi:hypothetical protein
VRFERLAEEVGSVIPKLMSKILGANWRTSVASFATAALGFVAMSPEFFAH